MTEQEMAEVRRDLERIVQAWHVPGPVPGYHRAWQERLRRDWPALANALDAAARRHP